MQGHLTIKRWRGNVIEAQHSAKAVVVSASGALSATCGRHDVVVPLLACGHPLSTMLLLGSGPRSLRLDEGQSAAAAGRYTGSDEQRVALRTLLVNAGLGDEHLQCGPRGPDHSCSSFHALLLAAARAFEEKSSAYRSDCAKVQKHLFDGLLRLVRRLRTEVPVCLDECGLPSPCLPLSMVAQLYAQLVDTSPLPAPLASAATSLLASIRNRPAAFAAPGTFEHDLLEATDGDLVIRQAENGLCAMAVRSRAWGVAVKVDDGNALAARVALLALIEELHLVVRGRAKTLLETLSRLRNSRGDRCGRLEVEVALARHD